MYQVAQRQDPISFSDVIRPILSNHCFQCHGPDEETRKAGLRLDLESEDFDFEEVLLRIQSDEPFEMMPPPSANKKLDAEKIDRLALWIKQGANYEQHWAFAPPQKDDVPQEVHPVDYFVDRQLKRKSLSRAKQADPALLIRRLYLDLIGLPPTLEQADEFINRPNQEVYQEIVNRLLDSPEYGERWARRWLDLARYADTNGYEKDRDRSIWPYRDWVIRAINRGMPFDQFTIEQLAGDMLLNPTVDQRIATGFHRNTMLNEEGGIDPLEFRFHAMTDRVATTGTTWLGLTTGCAQCHTHKFDPITHHNFFQMMAYLNNADEPDLILTTEESRLRQREKNQKAAQLLSELPDRWPVPEDGYEGPTLKQAFQDWKKGERAKVVQWSVINPDSSSTNSPYLIQESQGVLFAGGDTTKHDVYELGFAAIDLDIRSIRLEALPDSRHPASGPGMTYYEGTKGDFFLSELALFDKESRPREFDSASETYAANKFGNHPVSAKLATDGDLQTGWSVHGRSGMHHVAVFNLKNPISAGESFSIEMHFGRHFASSLGKFRLSVTDKEGTVQASTLDPTLINSLVDESENPELFHAFLMQASQLEKHSSIIRELKTNHVNPQTLVMRERPANHERKTYIHHRGEYTSPRDKVSPRLPDAIYQGAEKDMPSNRLEFARWLVSGENPLTARVTANRQWAAFFGDGLVSTLDDFGAQGISPSHPRLLDFLAVKLIEEKWSVKHLHRRIVTSRTYQQSSRFDVQNGPADTTHLQRFPRNRLEAEVIRDSALMASGLLNKKMFGPPVRPPQPAGAAANFQQSTWQASTGTERYRRSIYTYQKRTAPFAMYATFDAPSGELCVARRDVSNTPLQALTLLNDPMFMEIATSFGERISSVDGDNATKIETGFRWLLTRKPTPTELEMLVDFYEQHENWTALARGLLCLDEAITKN